MSRLKGGGMRQDVRKEHRQGLPIHKANKTCVSSLPALHPRRAAGGNDLARACRRSRAAAVAKRSMPGYDVGRELMLQIQISRSASSNACKRTAFSS